MTVGEAAPVYRGGWRRWAVLLLCVGAIVLVVRVVLPWAGYRGMAGATVRDNLNEGRDASALFYTEYEPMADIEAQFERDWQQSRE